MGGDSHRVGGAAGEPRPGRPRGDADRRRRRPAPREPCVTSFDHRSVGWRPRSVRDVPSRLSARRSQAGLGAGDDRLFLLGPVHRRGDYSHRRRQHRVDVRPPPNPADHALPRGRRFPCRASSSTARRCATSPLAALATARSTTKWEAPGSRASRPSTSSPSSRLSRPAKGGTTSASRCATSRGG